MGCDVISVLGDRYRGKSVWITSEVNLPPDVLDAQAEGKLVLFVGAGASVDPPSGLPLFGELARQLAEDACMDFHSNDPIDLFLGSMPENFDTHRHTRDLIAREDSKPNATHKALVRVASSVGHLRIVTTNFDKHLSTAAETRNIEIPDMWVGPALPLGHDFTGIVHLHGSIDRRDPQELVLTDRDFGRAYLTNAWATRFLLPMFEKFTVLFIGYSHDDLIMNYLARGLQSKTQQYALTNVEDAKEQKWSSLGIETIRYPVNDHSGHGALVAALEAWDRRARMGQTEHRAQMAEIITGGPNLTPVDSDYLKSRLESSDGAEDFTCEVANVEPSLQVEWLNWIERLPAFKAIFDGDRDENTAKILGKWFCDSFIAISDLHGEALQTVQRLGQRFDSDLFRAAGQAAEVLNQMDVEAGRRWKSFLATSIHSHSAPVSTDIFLPYSPGDHPEASAVLRAAFKPYLELKRPRTFSDSEDLKTIPDAQVQWNTDADSLTEHVLKAVETSVPADFTLGTMLEDALNSAYDLLDDYHSQHTGGLGTWRAAIEPHEQNQFPDPVDAVIDGLREYGEKALPQRPDILEAWWATDRPLFRRLALHLLGFDSSQTADQKILWLLEPSVLYEFELKYEIFRILKMAVGETSKDVRARLLAAVQAGPKLPENTHAPERHNDYVVYNLLVWLNKFAPEWSEAVEALKTIRAKNHDFKPRAHPELDIQMSSGIWGGKLPMEPEEFITRFESKPLDTVVELLNRDYSERNFAEPTWHDCLSLIRQVAESRPDLGEKLWKLLDENEQFDQCADDVHRSIVDGWAEASLGDLAETVVERVATQAKEYRSARSVSRFLLEQVSKQIDNDQTPALITMRGIAQELWMNHKHTFTHSGEAKPDSFAPLFLNSWPGELALYWMSEADRRWRKNRDQWSGLNDNEREALKQLLEGPPQAFDATGPAIASQLYFIFAADEAFTTEHILPLFQQDKTATLMWGAYLHHPRFDDKILAAGLLDSTIKEWDRLDDLPEKGSLRRRFFDLVVLIVSVAGITSEEREQLLDRSILANGGAYASDFAQAVERFLLKDGTDGIEVWRQWLSEHLRERLNGKPRDLGVTELRSWAYIIPYLGEAIPEAIELFKGHDIGLDSRFPRWEFPADVLSDHGSALVSYFEERIRCTPTDIANFTRTVDKLIHALQNTLGEECVQPLVDAARAKGFLGHNPAI